MRSIEHDNDHRTILFCGAGDRAFCAGGDVLHIADASLAQSEWNRRWFSSEFLLNSFISNLKKPVISIWKGIVMGGGVGLSIYGSHRIATDSTVFAMPETTIGFMPDIGASYFLSHSVKHPGVGLFLGMTGHRLNGADTLLCGLATHYIPQIRIDDFISALENRRDVDQVLSEFSTTSPDTPESSLNSEMLSSIATYFSHSAGEPFSAFFQRLEKGSKNGDKFAKSTMGILRQKCPLTVRVWYESFKIGSTQSLAQVLAREYRMCIHMTEIDPHNFREGVRAQLIDKGKGKPADFIPGRIEDVSGDMVDRIVKSTAGGDLSPII